MRRRGYSNTTARAVPNTEPRLARIDTLNDDGRGFIAQEKTGGMYCQSGCVMVGMPPFIGMGNHITKFTSAHDVCKPKRQSGRVENGLLIWNGEMDKGKGRIAGERQRRRCLLLAGFLVIAITGEARRACRRTTVPWRAVGDKDDGGRGQPRQHVPRANNLIVGMGDHAKGGRVRKIVNGKTVPVRAAHHRATGIKAIVNDLVQGGMYAADSQSPHRRLPIADPGTGAYSKRQLFV